VTDNNPDDGRSPGAAPAAEPGNIPSLARRHALLKGVGKGAAVLAASVPIRTLAAPTTLTFTADGRRCTISGAHSGVHSADTLTLVCGGYAPSYWGKSSSTNPFKPACMWPVDSAAACKNTFANCSLLVNNQQASLFQVVNNSAFATKDEPHWVAAWLNATQKAFNFPYTAAEVLAFYNTGAGSATYQNALKFFKDNLETHVA
jgi:hypothetical protein